MLIVKVFFLLPLLSFFFMLKFVLVARWHPGRGAERQRKRLGSSCSVPTRRPSEQEPAEPPAPEE